MEDVLKAVEDGFVVLDFVALAGVRPLLPALEVGVDLTGVGGVLFVVGHLGTEPTPVALKSASEDSPRSRNKKHWTLRYPSVITGLNRQTA